MINTRNSKKTKQKMLGHWARRLYKNEIRRKSHPNCKNKLKNVYYETTQRKLQKTEIGEQLKKDVDKTVGSKHFNMVNTKTKTLSYIMGPKTARNSDSTLVSPESTITKQSVCSIVSYEKVNNYGHGDSQTKEKHDANFFENMCVADNKLNLWDNMKYRFKSLGSAKSASNAYILDTQIRSNKPKSDFDIHKKLQCYSELKHRKPFSGDYLVMHLQCQQNDRKQGLSNKSLQKQETNFKTPAKEFQYTQQFSNSNETPRTNITKYPVVNFPEIEDQSNKNSLTTMTIKKFLQLAKPLTSKICRVANNTCDYSGNCIIDDSINFIKSKYDRAFARAEDKYTEPCNNFKHKSQMCFAGEKVKDKYTQNNNLKHQNKICSAHKKVKDKHTEPYNDLKHKNQKCFAGKEVQEKYIELSNNLKYKNHQHFVDEKFEEKHPEPCNKLKLKNQKYFAGEKVQEKYTDPCNNLKHKHQKGFSDQKVQKEDTEPCYKLHYKWFTREKIQDNHTEPCNRLKHKEQICFACNKVEENKSEPCQNSKHTNQIRFIDREKGCSNKSTKCQNISATSNQEKSQLNFHGTKRCKISHNDCVCRVAKKIKSNEICENLVQKQGNKVQKNLKNKTANSYACKDARRNPRCKDTNKNQGQSLERVKDRNVHRKKCNNKTITDACLRSHNDFKCNTDEIKSHGIAKTDNKIKQKQVIKKNNKNTNSQEYFKFHDDCTCSKANKFNSSKFPKICRNKKPIIINKTKNKKTNHKECIKFHDDCTCSQADKYNSNKTSKPCKNIKTINNNIKTIKNKKSNFNECIHEHCTCKTDKFNSNKISNTFPNIIATSNNVERYVKSTKESLIRRCINCILRHKTSQSQNRTHCNKTYSCHCRKECGVRGSSDYHKTNKGCDQKIWKHVRVRSKSSQMIQVSKFSDCDFHENSISIAVGKSYKCFKSNIDLTNPSKNNFTTWEEDKRLEKCVRIPKSRYTQCSSCLKPAIVSTKAQCGDGNAKHLRSTGKCFFSSERTQTIPPKHKSCIGKTSFDKNHKSFNRACTAIPQDHHYISCPKNLPIQYDMTRMSESCKPCKFNKRNIMKPARKKSPRPISVKKNKLKKKKKCKKFRPKHSCGDSNCKATWKENFREDMHCLLSRISQRAKKYFCGKPKRRGRKLKRPSNISNGYAGCNELYLEALKHKPPLFDTSPSCKNFSNCCCICTQMMCMFAFWCPLFFMFELFRKCFCLFWE